MKKWDTKGFPNSALPAFSNRTERSDLKPIFTSTLLGIYMHIIILKSFTKHADFSLIWEESLNKLLRSPHVSFILLFVLLFFWNPYQPFDLRE